MKPEKKDLRAAIDALLRAPAYTPLDQREMARALGRKVDGAELRRTLGEMERAGEVARIRKDRYVLPKEADLVTGKLQMHQSGFAFLTNEKAGGPDIYISAENTGTAMNGDRVVVRLGVEPAAHRRRRGTGDRPEGRVIRILERAHDTAVGTLQRSKKNLFYVVPDDPRFVHDIYVPPPRGGGGRKTAQVGDKVVVHLEPWESRHVNPEGEIIEVLGPAGAPGIDMLSIIRKHHLPTEFPRAVLDEAGRIPEVVAPEMWQGREDLRDQFICTIDPDDARDFDDAINVEETGNGWRLGVHIADVAAYVEPGSALDREALKRGNSVYLPDRVLPMLPERLSNGVCSLKPGVERLTHSAFMTFTRDGQMKNVRFARTVIRSAKRLTYKEAYQILQGPVRDELSQRLHTAWELAALLRRKRFAAGSLDLDFPEVKVWLDDKGKPVRLEKVENDESHQLIEEFMLAANEAVARELKNRTIPSVYRVHEQPDPDKLAEYRELVLSHGYKVGDLTQRPELQRLLKEISGKAEGPALKIGLLKSLKRARYAPQPLGHYGLAKNNYTHFTSPIRRYADLVVHRALEALSRSRRPALDASRVASMAEHLSTTERVAAEAEIDGVKMKKLEFFQQQLDQRNPQLFRAVIIDIRNYGMVIELPDVVLSGLIHVSSLTDDFYSFEPAQRRLVGRRTRRRFAVGDEVKVQVARVDLFKRQVDFTVAGEETTRPERGRGGARPARSRRR